MAFEVAQLIATMTLDSSAYESGIERAKEKLKQFQKANDQTIKSASQPSWATAFNRQVLDIKQSQQMQKYAQKVSPDYRTQFSAKSDLDRLNSLMNASKKYRKSATDDFSAIQKKVKELEGEVGKLRAQLEKKTNLDHLKGQMFAINALFRQAGRYALQYFGARQILRFANSFLETAKNMEAYRQRLRATMKDQIAADEVFERIVRWAAVNPIDTDEAIGAFVQLRAAAIENAEGAVKAVANLASVVNRDMRDVAAAIISGETEALRRLGIQVLRNGKNAIITSQGVKKVVEDDVNSIRAAIIEVANINYADAMEKRKRTFIGAVHTIRGQIQVVQKDIMGLDTGTPFYTMTQSLLKFSNAMMHWMNTPGYIIFIKKLQEDIMGLVGNLEDLASIASKAFQGGYAQVFIEWIVSLKLVKVLLRDIKAGILALPGLSAYLSGLGLGSWAVGPLGIAAASAATLKMNMAKGAQGYSTLEERQGLGLNKQSQISNLANIAEDIRAKEEMSRAKEEMYAMYAQIEKRKSEFWSTYNISGVPVWEKKIEEAAQQTVARFSGEMDKARVAVNKYGLDGEKVNAKIADDFVARAEDITRMVKDAAGEAGVPMLIRELEKLKGQVPGIELLVNAFKGIKNEASAAASRINGMTSEVAKAAAQGLIPKGAAQDYLKRNIPKAIDLMSKEVDRQYEGAPKEIRAGVLESRVRSTMEGAGWKRALENARYNPAFVRSYLGNRLENQFMSAGGDIYGFTRRRDQRSSGGYYVGQPGTIGDPNSRNEVRPTPRFGTASGSELLMEQARLADLALEKQKKSGLTIVINGVTITPDKGGEEAARTMLDAMRRNGVPIRSLSMTGASQ